MSLRIDHEKNIVTSSGEIHLGRVAPVDHFGSPRQATLNRPAGHVLTLPLVTEPGRTVLVRLRNSLIKKGTAIDAAASLNWTRDAGGTDPALATGKPEVAEVRASDGRAEFIIRNAGTEPFNGRVVVTYALSEG